MGDIWLYNEQLDRRETWRGITMLGETFH